MPKFNSILFRNVKADTVTAFVFRVMKKEVMTDDLKMGVGFTKSPRVLDLI